MTLLPVIAWTGGSKPLPVPLISHEERKILVFLFQEQIIKYLNYWHDYPDDDTVRIFWNRARYDAHATMRESIR